MRSAPGPDRTDGLRFRKAQVNRTSSEGSRVDAPAGGLSTTAREQIAAELRRMGIEKNAEIEVGSMLLGALQIGPNYIKLADAFEIPRKRAAVVAGRLRANGVWVGHKTRADWFDANGGVAFAMDVCVGLGLMERAEQTATSTCSNCGRLLYGGKCGSVKCPTNRGPKAGAT